jgi:hypothetical protein
MGLRQRIQEVIPSHKHHKEAYPAAYTGQERDAGVIDDFPGGHEEVETVTVAPRTESELEQHIANTPDVIKRLEHEPPPPEHSVTTSLTTANTHAALREAFRVLAMPEQLAVLTNIVRTEAGVVAKQAASKEALHTTRVTAREAFVGSYDAVEAKWQEWLKSLPQHTKKYAFCAAAFLALFLLGIFLAVWRFVLYGLN